VAAQPPQVWPPATTVCSVEQRSISVVAHTLTSGPPACGLGLAACTIRSPSRTLQPATKTAPPRLSRGGGGRRHPGGP